MRVGRLCNRFLQPECKGDSPELTPDTIEIALRQWHTDLEKNGPTVHEKESIF
jgi:hypothetical protein